MSWTPDNNDRKLPVNIVINNQLILLHVYIYVHVSIKKKLSKCSLCQNDFIKIINNVLISFINFEPTYEKKKKPKSSRNENHIWKKKITRIELLMQMNDTKYRNSVAHEQHLPTQTPTGTAVTRLRCWLVECAYIAHVSLLTFVYQVLWVVSQEMKGQMMVVGLVQPIHYKDTLI